MLAVADTSPINYLVLIQCEVLLPVLYTRVVIPAAVWHELQDPDTPPVVQAWVAHPPAWFAIQALRQGLAAREMPDLGDGEREAIVLAHELPADIVLMDEGNGRREAQGHRHPLRRPTYFIHSSSARTCSRSTWLYGTACWGRVSDHAAS